MLKLVLLALVVPALVPALVVLAHDKMRPHPVVLRIRLPLGLVLARVAL